MSSNPFFLNSSYVGQDGNIEHQHICAALHSRQEYFAPSANVCKSNASSSAHCQRRSMNPYDGTPLTSPSIEADPIFLPKVRSPEKAANRPSLSNYGLPFRRSNASLGALFASTTPSAATSRNNSSAAGTPLAENVPESVFSAALVPATVTYSDISRRVILRSFVPHIAVLSSSDTEDLLAQKGFTGGLLQLLRPYGENISGKVTIRDSAGSSRSWDDYAVRFIKLRDGLESSRAPERRSAETPRENISGYLDHYFPHSSARLRSGGDVPYVEDAVEKHLAFAEGQPVLGEDDLLDNGSDEGAMATSPFQLLYLRRLLSGLPLTPHETFSHPVACVVAVSSRHANPIEHFRQLSVNTTNGNERLPQWVNNEFLRYYVLVHDEEHDDVARSTTIYEQMKRHFGWHCHLLRLRSNLCVSTDDGAIQLPPCEWISAAEELSEIQKRETLGESDDATPYLFDSDAAYVTNFVREMVTQSVIPIMERLSATWNDQVVSRRRGISGRFLSLSKKWTPFGSASRSSSTGTGSSTNYDPLQGFYRPDASEAIMRKLADYAFMLRDFKLAQSVYDLLRTDFSNDKAWKYYAGANEMSALTHLLTDAPLTARTKTESVDQMLEAAVYSYTTRSAAPYNALRALLVGMELIMLRGSSSADDAARLAFRILELDLVGPIGEALLAERAATCYASRAGTGSKHWGARHRKAAFWSVLAAQAWLKVGKQRQAKRCLRRLVHYYGITEANPKPIAFGHMQEFIVDLQQAVAGAGDGVAMQPLETGLDPETDEVEELETSDVIEEQSEKLDVRPRRRSTVGSGFDPLGAIAMPPSGLGLGPEEFEDPLRRSDVR